MEKLYCVYILTNQWHTVFYTGITSNLPKRIFEHKNKIIEGFTKRYNIQKLIYYEVHTTAYEAISREKQIKRWRRSKKLALAKKQNPSWKDLSYEL